MPGDVRPAEYADIQRICDLGFQMYKESSGTEDEKFDFQLFATHVRDLINHPGGFLWVGIEDEEIVAVFAGQTVEYFFTKDFYVTDLMVYDVPGNRRSFVIARLFRAFYEWAEQIKAKEIQLTAVYGWKESYPPKVFRYLERFGFKQNGFIYNRMMR